MLFRGGGISGGTVLYYENGILCRAPTPAERNGYSESGKEVSE